MYMNLVFASARNICSCVTPYSLWLQSEKEYKIRAKCHGLETYFPAVVCHLLLYALLQHQREIDFEGRPAVPYSPVELTEQVIQCAEWSRCSEREGNQVIVLVTVTLFRLKREVAFLNGSDLSACFCCHIVIAVCYVSLSILRNTWGENN